MGTSVRAARNGTSTVSVDLEKHWRARIAIGRCSMRSGAARLSTSYAVINAGRRCTSASTSGTQILALARFAEKDFSQNVSTPAIARQRADRKPTEQEHEAGPGRTGEHPIYWIWKLVHGGVTFVLCLPYLRRMI